MDDTDLKDCDKNYWTAFAADGVLPEAVYSENDALGLLRASETPFMTLLLAGRTLEAVQGDAVDSVAQVRIANAFLSVLKTVLAKKRHFEHRDAMAQTLEAYAKRSTLSLLRINYGFWSTRCSLARRSDAEAPGYALQAYTQLKQRLAAEPAATALSGFLNLGLAIIRARFDTPWDGEADLLALLDRAPKDGFWEKRLAELKSRLATRAAVGPVETFRTVWTAEARKARPSSLALGEALQPLMPLVGTEAWTGMRFGDTETVRFTVFEVLAPWLKKLPEDDLLRRRVLGFLRLDGLAETGHVPLFRRHARHGGSGTRSRGPAPSLGERLGQGVYVLCKELYGTDGTAPEEDRELLLWAVGFLGRLLTQFPEDPWGAYRLGRLMAWAGQTEALRAFLLPLAERHQDDFWLWDLLGCVYPDRRKACVARALCCGGAQRSFMKAIFEEGRRLGLPRSEPFKLRALGKAAEALLRSDAPAPDADADPDTAPADAPASAETGGTLQAPALLTHAYTTKDKGLRYIFSDRSGKHFRVVPAAESGLGREVRPGLPVTVTYDPSTRKIRRIEPRSGAEPWDLLAPVPAVLGEWTADRNGHRIAVIVTRSQNVRWRGTPVDAVPGTPLLVRLGAPLSEGHANDCLSCEKDTSPGRSPWDTCSERTSIFQGEFRCPRNPVCYRLRANGITYRTYSVPRSLPEGAAVHCWVPAETPKHPPAENLRFSQLPRAFGVTELARTGAAPQEKPSEATPAVPDEEGPNGERRTVAVCCGPDWNPEVWKFSSGDRIFLADRAALGDDVQLKPGWVYDLMYRPVKDPKTLQEVPEVLSCVRSKNRASAIRECFHGLVSFRSDGACVDLYDLKKYHDFATARSTPPIGRVLIPDWMVAKHRLGINSCVLGDAVRLPDDPGPDTPRLYCAVRLDIVE